MSITWPKYVVFQSTSGGKGGKYLKYASEGVPGVRPGYIQSSAEEAVNPYAKFEIEVANGGLVHIKSCYNNKYWRRVSNSAAEPQLLAACADAPEEDRSKWTCTLFQPDVTDTIRFKHVQRNAFVTHNSSTNADCLHLNRSRFRLFSVIDWESLIILPRFVAFKGVANNRYLSVKVWRSENYLSLDGTSISTNGVAQEAFNAPDGSSRFKSISYNRFWRFKSPWIMVDAAQTNRSRETMFQLVKGGGKDTVAIRNLQSARFLAERSKGVYIESVAETPVRSTFLKVENAVLRREIKDIAYRLSDATVYNEEPIVMVSADASNMSTEDEILFVGLTFTEETTGLFNNSVSAGLKVEITSTFGVPTISEGKIGLSLNTNYKYEWGKTRTDRKRKEDGTTVTVRPGSRVHVRVLATKGTCHVPFSYTQVDYPITSKDDPFRTTKHDGVYIGTNFYNVHPEADEEPL